MQNTNAQVQVAKRYRPKHDGFKRMETSEIVFKIFSYFFLTLFALICLYPFIYSIAAAFSGRLEFNAGDVILFPVNPQIDAFVSIIQQPQFWNSYCNTLFITLYGTIYCMLIGILGGYALSKKRLFGHKFFNFMLVFTMWFTAGMIPMYLNYQATGSLMNSIGIGDDKWMIVVAMGMSAYNIILLRNAFEGVSPEIEEAAKVDGANEFQICSRVYVPMSKATIATVALFFGISRWNGYFWAKQMLSITDAPLQVYIQDELETINSGEGKYDLSTWNEVYAPQSLMYSMIICAIIPILLVYPFIQKYFAAGVNLGGVKE